jgi:HSP20 family protein
MADSTNQSQGSQPQGNQPQGNQPQAIQPTQRGETARRNRESPLVEYGSPFSMMRRLMNEMDSLFEDFWNGPSLLQRLPRYDFGSRGFWTPQVDVTERDGNLVVHADLPGLQSEDVKVSVDENVLTISGERTDENEDNQGGIHRKERRYGSFHRSIRLPEDVDPESIQASFQNGVLEVTMPMPKESGSKGREIPITSKENAGEVH